MKFSCSTYCYQPLVEKKKKIDVQEAVKSIIRAGYEGVDLLVGEQARVCPALDEETSIKKIVELIEITDQLGGKISSLHMGFLHVNDVSRGIEQIKWCASIARLLSVPFIQCLPHKASLPQRKSYQNLKEILSQTSHILEKADLKLLFENHTLRRMPDEDPYMMRSVDEMLEAVTIISGPVGLAVDCAWLYAAGDDPIKGFETLIPKATLLHLKDVTDLEDIDRWLQGANDVSAFVAVGHGRIDFKKLFDVIKQSGYRGYLGVEVEVEPEVHGYNKGRIDNELKRTLEFYASLSENNGM